MWFCEIDARLEMGRNIPWFMMDAHDPSFGTSPGPALRRIDIRSVDDIAALHDIGEGEAVLRLVPDLGVFRDSGFLVAVSQFAVAKKVPVELEGSDFVVLLSGEPQGGIKIRRRNPDEFRKRDSYSTPFSWW